MDDKPAIEYHPFGGVTFNFDDAPIRLRRCRLGDLEFAKNYLEELRLANAPVIDGLIERLNVLQEEAKETVDEGSGQVELSERYKKLNVILNEVTATRQESVYLWLDSVIQRMGDKPAPPKSEWPLELFRSVPVTEEGIGGTSIVIADILNHWQNRPLASGRPSPNGTTSEAANLPPSQPVASSPQAPPPQ